MYTTGWKQSNSNDNHGLKIGREVAVGCRTAIRRRSSSVKMAAPIATCNLRFSCGLPSCNDHELIPQSLCPVLKLFQSEFFKEVFVRTV